MLLLVSVACWSCKKEEPAQEPEPVPAEVQTGELKIKVIAVNAVGDTTADHNGVKVTLQTGATATTNAEGIVSFPGLTYGTYAPSLLKSGFEGPPVGIELKNPVQESNLPLAQHSAHQLSKLQCQVVSAASINMYFEVNLPCPDKGLKVAILTHTSAPTAGNFSSVDLVTVNSQTVNAMNIAGLPDLTAFLNTQVKGSVFYVTAIPVSFGLYKSNLLLKPNLLGEALYAYTTIQLIKNW